MRPLSYYVIENVEKNETKYRIFNLCRYVRLTGVSLTLCVLVQRYCE